MPYTIQQLLDILREMERCMINIVEYADVTDNVIKKMQDFIKRINDLLSL